MMSIPYRFRNSTLEIYPKEVTRDVIKVLSICNSDNWETTQMSSNRKNDKLWWYV